MNLKNLKSPTQLFANYDHQTQLVLEQMLKRWLPEHNPELDRAVTEEDLDLAWLLLFNLWTIHLNDGFTQWLQSHSYKMQIQIHTFLADVWINYLQAMPTEGSLSLLRTRTALNTIIFDASIAVEALRNKIAAEAEAA